MAGLFQILTAGSTYEPEGRLSVSVDRSMEAMAGSFTIKMASDQPGDSFFGFPDLGMGGDVTIMLDGKVALTGAIDKRSGHGGPESYEITITGRSKTRNLVDSSPDHKTGQIDKKRPGQIIKEICDTLEIDFADENDVNEIIERFIIREGETAERAIRRAGREHGLLPFDDEHGRLKTAKPGAGGTGAAFVAGENILEWTATQDQSVRHSEVKAKGQALPTDKRYGKAACEITHAVKDLGVLHKRPLVIPYFGDATKERVERRARIEAKRRQGESLSVTVTVPGFTDPSTGKLYAPNVKHHVRIPLDGVDNEMIAKSVSFSLEAESARTTITLAPPEAFSDGAKEQGAAKGGKTAARKKGAKTGGASKAPKPRARPSKLSKAPKPRARPSHAGGAASSASGGGGVSSDARTWWGAIGQTEG